MERFPKAFGAGRIEALPADREFVGEDWFRWLQKQGIPFHQRLKRNTLVPNAWNRTMRLDTLFGSLRPGECYRLRGRRPVWGCFVHLSALRLPDGGFLFIASSGAPRAGAVDACAGRRQVETLFVCLKSRDFNFEDTRLTDPARLAKLMGLLALAFAWTYQVGQLLHEQKPVLLKKPSSAHSNPFSATASTSSATLH